MSLWEYRSPRQAAPRRGRAWKAGRRRAPEADRRTLPTFTPQLIRPAFRAPRWYAAAPALQERQRCHTSRCWYEWPQAGPSQAKPACGHDTGGKRAFTRRDSGNAVSLLLHKTIGREFPDAFGRTRKLDALGIDSGFRTHVVYATVRANHRLLPGTGSEPLYALDGREDWGRPPIGTPRLVDIDLAGSRVRQGAKLCPVGAWSIKGSFYADLRREGVRAGAEVDPPGYVHFGSWLDDDYFRQITSEYLTEETFKGRTRRYWRQRAGQRDNHQLDNFGLRDRSRRASRLVQPHRRGVEADCPPRCVTLRRTRDAREDAMRGVKALGR